MKHIDKHGGQTAEDIDECHLPRRDLGCLIHCVTLAREAGTAHIWGCVEGVRVHVKVGLLALSVKAGKIRVFHRHYQESYGVF